MTNLHKAILVLVVGGTLVNVLWFKEQAENNSLFFDRLVPIPSPSPGMIAWDKTSPDVVHLDDTDYRKTFDLFASPQAWNELAMHELVLLTVGGVAWFLAARKPTP